MYVFSIHYAKGVNQMFKNRGIMFADKTALKNYLPNQIRERCLRDRFLDLNLCLRINKIELSMIMMQSKKRMNSLSAVDSIVVRDEELLKQASANTKPTQNTVAINNEVYLISF